MGIYLHVCHVTIYTCNDVRKSIKLVIHVVNYYSCLWVFIYVM